MKIEQCKCDVCGTIKGETNRWWVVQRDQVVDGATKEFVLTAIHVYPVAEFAISGDLDLPAFDLCGERCVIAKVSELMGEAQ